MWRLILVVYYIFILNQFGVVENTGLRIPLFRQKTPRENGLNNPHMTRYGVSMDWIHKPHKHNHTNDSIALFRYLDNEFYGKVLIGQKGKMFNMVFDTAWTSSWVISEDCSWKSVGCWFHNKYDHHASSTYVANGTKFIAQEGDYNLTGYYSNDTFVFGHSRVNGQMFIEMTSIPNTYFFNKADGVMGLGLKTNDYTPFFDNLRKQSNITNALFSIYLSRDRQSPRGGDLLLGIIDHKHIHQVPSDDPKKPNYENITYLSVDSDASYWKFNIQRIELNDTSKNKTYAFCATGCKGFPDTSSTIIVGPKSAVDAIHILLRAKLTYFGLYKVDCDTTNKLPPISFILGGKKFTLKGNNYTQKMSVGGVTFCVSAFRASTLPFEQDSWILGAAFLSEFYSIYDIKKGEIGFVRAA